MTAEAAANEMWTPDIYEGASAPVAALVTTVSKGAMLTLMQLLMHGSALMT